VLLCPLTTVSGCIWICNPKNNHLLECDARWSVLFESEWGECEEIRAEWEAAKGGCEWESRISIEYEYQGCVQSLHRQTKRARVAATQVEAAAGNSCAHTREHCEVRRRLGPRTRGLCGWGQQWASWSIWSSHERRGKWQSAPLGSCLQALLHDAQCALCACHFATSSMRRARPFPLSPSAKSANISTRSTRCGHCCPPSMWRIATPVQSRRAVALCDCVRCSTRALAPNPAAYPSDFSDGPTLILSWLSQEWHLLAYWHHTPNEKGALFVNGYRNKKRRNLTHWARTWTKKVWLDWSHKLCGYFLKAK